MKFLKYSFLILTLFVFNNCSRDEGEVHNSISEDKPEPEVLEKEVYLTIQVETDKNTADSDDWIIIHDETGKLLDFQSFESGEELIFKAFEDSLTSSFSMTELNHITDYIDDLNDGTTPQTRSEIGRTNRIHTTCGLTKGSFMKIKSAFPSDSKERIETGEFELTIDNIPQILNLEISTKNGLIPYSYSSSSGTELFTYGATLKQYEGEEEYLISILDGFNSLKYITFKNVENSSLHIDYSDFELFNSYLEVEFPENSNYRIDIGAFENDQQINFFGGFNLIGLSFGNLNINTAPFRFGYLDRFSKYRTNLEVEISNYTYNITSYGLPIESINLPADPGFRIVNDASIQEFSFSSDLSYISSTNTWRYVEGRFPFETYIRTTWEITAPKEYDAVIGGIPDEILAFYPKLNLDKLEYWKTYLNLLEEENLIYPSKEGITIYNN